MSSRTEIKKNRNHFSIESEADLRIEEGVNLNLRKLYSCYGYRQFKMGKFEEYDLYIRNRDFIPSESIITFRGKNAKLLALRPDLTLSIVKNHRPIPGETEKIYYCENIYRTDKGGNHCELMQTGLECLGTIDMFQLGEVVTLAIKSLETITNQYVLDISHMGILMEFVKPIPLEYRSDVLKFISEKNQQGLKKLLVEIGSSEEIKRKLVLLVESYGDIKNVLKKLKGEDLNTIELKYLNELEIIKEILKTEGLDKRVNLDFSIVNNMNYYSGIVFQGYIEGLPSAILSGGQYDGVMEHMGKKSSAVGFAIYLDDLKQLSKNDKDKDVDVLVIYNPEDALDNELVSYVESIRNTGKKVIAEQKTPKGLTYGKLVKYKRKKQ